MAEIRFQYLVTLVGQSNATKEQPDVLRVRDSVSSHLVRPSPAQENVTRMNRSLPQRKQHDGFAFVTPVLCVCLLLLLPSFSYLGLPVERRRQQ